MDTLVPRGQGLSESMRTGSRAEHEAAESSGFMASLVAGTLPAAAYADYLLRYVRVYEALEQTVRALADTVVGRALYDPALERADRLAADLEHWVGLQWRSVPLESPAVAAYIEAVGAVVLDPPLLIAHHYTRYLGDLAGGQVIGRAMTRQHGLAPGVGVDFYDFSDLGGPGPARGKVKPYRDAYRARVDALGLNAEEHRRVVEEVRHAFALNTAIFAELGALHEA